MRRGGPETIRPGLERIRTALEMTGHPESAFRAIHVAGTNGKGSTAAFVEAILRKLAPGPVGLYTSPHLISPEERIRVDGEKIPRGTLRRAGERAARLSRRVERACGDPLSWFEEMTWTAFDLFSKASVRIAVVETGLGGRWDATSACVPSVSVLTTVGIDHREWLGGTLREIAAEKAAIFRKGVPAILGRLGKIPRSVAVKAAMEAGAPVWEIGRDFDWEERTGGRISIRLPGAEIPQVKPAMRGVFQRDNAAVACAAAWRWASGMGVEAKRFEKAARGGLQEAKWPGRFSPLPGRGNKGVWADGAHNPDAARALSRELSELKAAGGPSRIVALWSMLGDKDAGGFLSELSDIVDGWVVFPMSHERAAPLDALALACRRGGYPFLASGGFEEGWEAAKRWAGPSGMVIVCGSLAAVGEAYLHRVGEVR